MIHKIKLREDFIEPVVKGDKNFEIRFNDRGYQKGDYIKFIPVDKDGKEIQKIFMNKNEEEIIRSTYEITYVLNGWGLQDGYVVFGFYQNAWSREL